MPAVSTLPNGNVRLTVRRAALADDVLQEVESSNDLPNWSDATVTLVNRSMDSGIETLIYEVTLDSGTANCFLRVRYELR